jgi:hypothetical protein
MMMLIDHNFADRTVRSITNVKIARKTFALGLILHSYSKAFWQYQLPQSGFWIQMNFYPNPDGFEPKACGSLSTLLSTIAAEECGEA